MWGQGYEQEGLIFQAVLVAEKLPEQLDLLFFLQQPAA